MPETPETIKVRTTLPKRPLPSNSQRAVIKTARLTVRHFIQDDVHGIHILRTQPEVMVRTAVGLIDKDLAETQAKLDHFLPPKDEVTFNYAICLTETGETIGMGGMHRMESGFGWPEVGYMLKREHWGKGYATEFMKAFVESYWELEREEVDIDVDVMSVNVKENVQGVQTVPELLIAVVAVNNPGSLKVLEKTGFETFKTWTEPDSRAGFEGLDIALIGLAVTKEIA
ncbi:GNAT domain-containing protein [Truncatella angustata]|uniref:GNAT domain-containing protein n=1 Tax=Truncatella angustata TaxID=152316 RepID=A0A9P8US64_9PEZI|nr:GNAT domain-containing protein [Truncatella angustata]KAH6657263.1 GNAT domain-containing protein [Truncatella angustata]KAH8197561.1 hypothetical protein TruAng_008297 [Truncatella angustata]